MRQLLFALAVTMLLLTTLPLWAQGVGDTIIPITNVNVRSCASTNCSVLTSRSRDQAMEIIDVVEGQEVSGSTRWYHVETIMRSGNITEPRVYEGYVHSGAVESANISGRNTATSQSIPLQVTTRSVNAIREIYRNTRISPLTLQWYPEIVPVGTDHHLDDDGLDINVLALLSGDNPDEYAIVSTFACTKDTACEISAKQFAVSYTLDDSDPTADQEGLLYFGQELLPLNAESTPQPEIRLRPGQEEVIVIFLEIDDWRPQTAAVSFLSTVAFSDIFWYVPIVLTFSEFENMITESQ